MSSMGKNNVSNNGYKMFRVLIETLFCCGLDDGKEILKQLEACHAHPLTAMLPEKCYSPLKQIEYGFMGIHF